MFKVFNVGSLGDCRWIDNAIPVSNPYEANIITFPGGSDIDPAIYGEPVGMYTSFYEHVDNRDLKFLRDPKLANTFKVGLCRGAQILTAISGGKLVQHFREHGGGHNIMINNDPSKVLVVNSLHHQMMYPFGLPTEDYTIIGRAINFSRTGSIGRVFLDGNNRDINMPSDQFGYIEPEIVFYPKTKALCFQFHPEFMSWSHNKETLTYCNNLLVSLYNDYNSK